MRKNELGKFAYFKIRKNHFEICGRLDPCSYHELLFYVEAPKCISGINIWDFVENYDLADHPAFKKKQKFKPLLRAEVEQYPYYELLCYLWRGYISPPLILEEFEDGAIRCLEGKHRFRILNLFCRNEPDYFKEVFPTIPVVIVKHSGFGLKRSPKRFREFADWVRINNINVSLKKMKELFNEKFVL
jgi:hypothetical protein